MSAPVRSNAVVVPSSSDSLLSADRAMWNYWQSRIMDARDAVGEYTALLRAEETKIAFYEQQVAKMTPEYKARLAALGMALPPSAVECSIHSCTTGRYYHDRTQHSDPLGTAAFNADAMRDEDDASVLFSVRRSQSASSDAATDVATE